MRIYSKRFNSLSQMSFLNLDNNLIIICSIIINVYKSTRLILHVGKNRIVSHWVKNLNESFWVWSWSDMRADLMLGLNRQSSKKWLLASVVLLHPVPAFTKCYQSRKNFLKPHLHHYSSITELLPLLMLFSLPNLCLSLLAFPDGLTWFLDLWSGSLHE